jgi:hypothetical protein
MPPPSPSPATSPQAAPVAPQGADPEEAAFQQWAAQRAQGPIGLARWLERAQLNRMRQIDGQPPLPHWPLTDEQAQQWAAREAQGLPSQG